MSKMIRFSGKIGRDSLFAECFVISLLLMASIRFSSYINIITLAFCLWVALTKSHEAVLCLCLFLLSFLSVFKLGIGSGFSLFNFVMIAFLARLLYEKRFRLPSGRMISAYILCFYVLITGISNGVTEPVSFVMFILIGLGLLGGKQKKISLPRLTEYASGGVVMSSAIGCLRSFFPRIESLRGSARIKLDRGVYYYRFSGLFGNPNAYTVLPSVLLGIFLVLLIRKQLKALDIFYAVLILIFGLMSSSMSFVACVGVTFAAAAVIILRHKPKFIPLFFFALAVLGIVLYCFRDSDFMQTVLHRLERMAMESTESEDVAADITTGRTVVWGMYFQYFIEHPLRLLFGNGIGANTRTIIGYESHSTFIEMLFYLGIIGTVFYLITMWRLFSPNRFGRKRRDPICYVPFLALFVRMSARCLLGSEQFFFLLLLAAVSVWSEGERNRMLRRT